MQTAHHIEASLECGLEITLPMFGKLPTGRCDADDDRPGSLCCGFGRGHPWQAQRDLPIRMGPLAEYIRRTPIPQSKGGLAIGLEPRIAEIQKVRFAKHVHGSLLALVAVISRLEISGTPPCSRHWNPFARSASRRF